MEATLLAPRARRERVAQASAKMTTTGASALVVVALAGTGVFLAIQGSPAFFATSENLPADAGSLWSLAGPLVFGSLWSSIIALIMASPVAIGIALFITWYAPRRIAGLLSAVIDLLAAVPSVIYGLWGLMILAPAVAPIYEWLGEHLGWIPFFSGSISASGRTIFTAAMILAIMIVPIMASLCREVFQRTPTSSIEAAAAIGATRWEQIRLTVFRSSRSGIVSGAMLGLGRALGETMATAMIISPTPFLVGFSLISQSNPNTVAAFIAQYFPEAHGIEVNALIALGLVLFAITFAVNWLARWIIARGGQEK